MAGTPSRFRRLKKKKKKKKKKKSPHRGVKRFQHSQRDGDKVDFCLCRRNEHERHQIHISKQSAMSSFAAWHWHFDTASPTGLSQKKNDKRVDDEREPMEWDISIDVDVDE
jgi:hypothetical protein